MTALPIPIIERLETDFDPEVVESVLTLLSSARRGLSDRELLDLLEGPDIAIEASTSDLFPVLRRLRPYLLDRGCLLGFSHDDPSLAVQGYHPNTDRTRRAAHNRLADYFEGRETFLESLDALRGPEYSAPPTPRPANVRKIDELPWQLLHAEQWDRLASLLRELPFLEAKAEAGLVFDLAMDFTRTVDRMPAGHPALPHLRLLGEALRLDAVFLSRHPTALFQCLWNRGWWYDSPEASRHDVPPPGGRPRDLPVPRLADLLECWRAERARRPVLSPWLRAIRPPAEPLGGSRQVVLCGQGLHIARLAFSPDGRRVATADEDGTVDLWDAEIGVNSARMDWPEAFFSIRGVTFSPDGRHVTAWAGGIENAARLWDAETGAELGRLQGCDHPVLGVTFTPDGRRLACGSYHRTARLWDAETGCELARIEGADRCRVVALSPDGRRLAAGFHDGTIRIWDASTGQSTPLLHARGDDIWVLTFSPDGRRLASGSNVGIVRIWNVQTADVLANLVQGEYPVHAVRFFPDGRRVVIDASGVQVWDIETGTALVRLNDEGGAILTPDGRRLATSSRCTVRVWDAGTGAELARFEEGDGHVRALEFSPDGRRLAAGFESRTVRVWDIHSFSEPPRTGGHRSKITGLVLSPDGRRLATYAEDGTARVWDAETGAELHRIDQFSPYAIFVVFSPDGRRLALGAYGGYPRLCDVDTGAELARLEATYKETVTGVSFSPGSRYLATASSDGEVRVWDARAGEELARRKAGLPGRSAIAVRFTSEECVAIGHHDDTAQLWKADLSECLGSLPYGQVFGVGDTCREPICWHAVASRTETEVRASPDGPAVAWFPAGLTHLIAHPSGNLWFGARWGKLAILKLEGVR